MSQQRKVGELYIALKAQTAEFKRAMNEARGEIQRWSGEMKAQTTEAKASMGLLGEEIGVRMPRHLRSFVAELPGVAAAMSAAFNVVAVVGLITIVVEAGKKIEEFASKNAEAAEKNRAAWETSSASYELSNSELDLANVKLENQIAKLQNKPQNSLKEALADARVEAEKLAEKLTTANDKVIDLLKNQANGWFASAFLGGSSLGYEQTMAQQHGIHMSEAGTPDEQLRESKSYGSSLQARLAELQGMKSHESSILADGYAKEIDAVQHLIARQQAEQHFIEATIEHSSLSGQKGQAEAGKDAAEAAKKAAAEHAKALGDVWSVEFDRQKTVAAESERIDNEVFENWSRLMREQDAAEKQQESNRKKSADDYIKQVKDQIAAQEELIRVAAKRYQDTDRGSAERVKLGEESPLERNLELTNAASEEQAAKVAAYEAIADLLSSIGQGGGAAWQKAQDGITQAETDGQQKIADIHSQWSEKIAEEWDHALGGINDQLAALMTGGRTSWKGMFQSESRSLAKSGLESIEHSVLGIHGKADGYHMWVDNLPGAGGSAGGTSLGGLLGMLNDSDWASSLFGGHLFGSGSIFGGFASGGDAPAGVPITVGELGPETLTLPFPGHVTPHNQVRSAGAYYSIVVNGGDPELNRANFEQALAHVHGSAVQSSAAVQREANARLPRSKQRF